MPMRTFHLTPIIMRLVIWTLRLISGIGARSCIVCSTPQDLTYMFHPHPREDHAISVR